MWSPVFKRWVFAKEKAASLGFAVYPTVAAQADVPTLEWDSLCLPAHGSISAHQGIGNSMCVPNVGMVLLIGLTCADPLSADAAKIVKDEVQQIVAGKKWNRQKHLSAQAQQKVVDPNSVLVPKAADDYQYLPTVNATSAKSLIEGALVIGDFAMGKFLMSNSRWAVVCGREEPWSRRVKTSVFRAKALYIPGEASPAKDLRAQKTCNLPCASSALSISGLSSDGNMRAGFMDTLESRVNRFQTPVSDIYI